MTDNLPAPVEVVAEWRYLPDDEKPAGTDLAMHGPTAADLTVSATTIRRLKDSIPHNTARAYTFDMKPYEEWCDSEGRTTVPATPETMAEYVTHLAELGRAPRTIERALSSIRKAHSLARIDPPNDQEALNILKGYRQQRADEGKRDKQATAVLLPQLRKMIESAPDGIAGTRDRALIVLGWAMMARRSELAALNWADIQETDEGLEVLVRKSKTDQNAIGEVVHLPYGSHSETCPVRLIRTWRAALAERGFTDGPVWRSIDRNGRLSGEEKFAGSGAGSRRGSTPKAGRAPSTPSGRLSADGIAKIMARAARAAGLGNFSPHGLRSGGATEAYRAGSDPLTIARHGRWTDGSPVLYRYVRSVDKWKNNPMRGIGL